MIEVFDDLTEIVDTLLQHFDTFTPILNELHYNEYIVSIPKLCIHFFPINYDDTITIKREKYVLAGVGPLLEGGFLISGYIKLKWLKSPLFVYPVFYDGIYADIVYFSEKEMLEHEQEVIEAYKEAMNG